MKLAVDVANEVWGSNSTSLRGALATRYAVIARSAGDEATQAVPAEQVWIASLSLAMTILVYSVIARSDCDEATQAVPAEQLRFASLSLAMTILVRTQASLPRTFPVSRRPQRDGKRRTVPAGP